MTSDPSQTGDSAAHHQEAGQRNARRVVIPIMAGYGVFALVAIGLIMWSYVASLK